MTATPTRRFLALHLPNFATDRLRRAEPALRDGQPLATWGQFQNRRLLVAVDSAAAEVGLRPGLALADAQAIVPHLLLRPTAPAADAATLNSLAVWMQRYTPLTAVDSPDGVLLDVTGCAHLLGDERALLADALIRLVRAGFTVRGAVAGAAATAAALARSRRDNPVAVSGIEAELAAPLPLGSALRLSPVELASLARLGLHCVGDLMRQPRAPLARRFGPALIARLDAVTGQRPASIQPVLSPPALGVSREMPEPIITRAGIEAVLDLLLAELCEQLRQSELGVRRLALSAWRVDGVVQTIAIGTGLPVREPAHLRRLFAERLERLEPDLGFERMALEAQTTEPMAAGVQAGLGISHGQWDADVAMALAQLLDRLGQRLRVHRVTPVASHWPERAVATRDPHGATPAIPMGWIAQSWPVLLLRRPQPLEAVALLTDGPPSLLRWRGVAHRLNRAEGPLRLEPEWWRDRSGLQRRDYYQVDLASGARLWVCRTGPPKAPRWLLHGHLP